MCEIPDSFGPARDEIRTKFAELKLSLRRRFGLRAQEIDELVDPLYESSLGVARRISDEKILIEHALRREKFLCRHCR